MLPSSNTEFFTLSQSISQLQYCTAFFESNFLYGMPIRARPVERRCNTVTLFPKISQKICQAPAGRLRPEVLHASAAQALASRAKRSGKDLGFQGILLPGGRNTT